MKSLPALRRIRLGACGPEVTRLGAGCWATGGPSFNAGRPTGWSSAEDEAVRMGLAYAVAAGVNHFDVADVYGMGDAERRLGHALADVPRAGVHISGKVGYFRGTAVSAYHPRQMRTQFGNTLENLGTAYLDRYAFHNLDFGPDDAFLAPAIALMREWCAEGLVRAVGLRALHRHTENSLDVGDRVDRFLHLAERIEPDVVHLKFNILSDPDPARSIAAWADRNGLGIVINKPLAQGLALDKHRPEAPPTFGAGDHRSIKPEFSAAALTAIHSRLCQLLDRLGADRADLPRLALGYALSLSPNACTVVGFTRESQIADILSLDGMSLTPEEVETVDEVMRGLASELSSLSTT